MTLRMHVRHERLFTWLVEKLPGSRLYGPYHHGGRDYYQWMARGQVLRETLVPLLLRRMPMLDDHAQQRIGDMVRDYKLS